MPKVPKTRLDDLPQHERDEIEEILAEATRLKQPYGTARFVSDEGDSMAFPLLLWIASIGGIVGILVNWPLMELVSLAVFIPAAFPQSLFSAKIVFAFLLSAVVFVWVPAHFARVHRRHGWMLTSFGFVTIRGRTIRLSRFAEIASAKRRRIRGRNSFSVITLETAGGVRHESYAGALFESLKTRLPGTAQVTEE